MDFPAVPTVADVNPATGNRQGHVQGTEGQGKPCLLLAIGYTKTETPERESLSKVIIYSILNKNTYYRLNRMSAVAPFSS